VGKPGSGISLQAFEKQSTTTKIQVWESEEGRLVIKSTPRCDQGLVGIGSGTSFRKTVRDYDHGTDWAAPHI